MQGYKGKSSATQQLLKPTFLTRKKNSTLALASTLASLTTTETEQLRGVNCSSVSPKFTGFPSCYTTLYRYANIVAEKHLANVF